MNLRSMTNLNMRGGIRLLNVRFILCLILISGLLFTTGFAQECSQTPIVFAWNQIKWHPGDHSGAMSYELPDKEGEEVGVVFQVSTNALGSFHAFDLASPYIDGNKENSNFGEKVDLGVMFDPAANQGISPVQIKMKFDRPVQCVQFQISDIDIAGDRIDSVVVYANGGEVTPEMVAVSTIPTVKVLNHTARAIGPGTGRAK
jgi:hypothetical protein